MDGIAPNDAPTIMTPTSKDQNHDQQHPLVVSLQFPAPDMPVPISHSHFTPSTPLNNRSRHLPPRNVNHVNIARHEFNFRIIPSVSHSHNFVFRFTLTIPTIHIETRSTIMPVVKSDRTWPGRDSWLLHVISFCYSRTHSNSHSIHDPTDSNSVSSHYVFP
jgi:hypothetical protein